MYKGRPSKDRSAEIPLPTLWQIPTEPVHLPSLQARHRPLDQGPHSRKLRHPQHLPPARYQSRHRPVPYRQDSQQYTEAPHSDGTYLRDGRAKDLRGRQGQGKVGNLCP